MRNNNNNNNSTMMIRLEVDRMMCQRSCGTTVENALRAVPGVVEAQASFATSSAWARIDAASGTTADDLMEAVEGVGFEARSSSSTTQTHTKLYFHVQGMMCQRNCGTTVHNAVTSVKGVVQAEASFRYQQAWALVSLLDDIAKLQDDIVDAIECVGFDASIIATPEEALAQQEHVQQQEQQQQQLYASTSEEKTDTNNSMISQTFSTDTSISHGNSSDSNSDNDLEDASAKNNVIVLSVQGMSCAVCTGRVERCLLQVPGVTAAFVSLATHRAEITYDNNNNNNNSNNNNNGHQTAQQVAQACQERVQTTGYPCEILSAGHSHSMTLQDNAKTLHDAKFSELREWRNLLFLAVVLLVPMLCLKRQMGHTHGDMTTSVMLSGDGDNNSTIITTTMQQQQQQYHHSTTTTTTTTTMSSTPSSVFDNNNNTNNSTTISWDNTNPDVMTLKDYHLSTPMGQMMLAMAILSSLSQFLVGYRYYKAAWKAGRDFGMDFLIVLGTTSSYVYSVGVWLWLLIGAHTTQQIIVGSDNTTLAPTFGTGAMLLTFVTFGKFLEAYAKGKTSSALEALMNLQPVWASRVVRGMENWTDPTLHNNNNNNDDMNGQQQQQQQHDSNNTKLLLSALETEEVSAWDVQIGDYLRVLPGSRIPADGVIVALSSSSYSSNSSKFIEPPSSEPQQAVAFIDESAFSGEPFPVAKTIHDTVYGSSVNQLTVLIIRVTATGSDSVLAKIVRLMEDAQRQKAPIQALADKIASVFAPAVMGLALITFGLWVILDSQAETTQERIFLAFLSAISVVVVACPCALGLATPTAVMVGTGVGAKLGLLIKGGSVLEEMQAVDTIVFDKTGTLTTGKAVLGEHKELVHDWKDPLLQHIPSKVRKDGGGNYNNTSSDGHHHSLALWLAACAEHQSEHPLAKAVVNAAKSLWGGDVTCSQEGVAVDDFLVVPGSGVECRVSKPMWGSYFVRVGNKQWAQAAVASDSSSLLLQGKTAAVAEDNTGDIEISKLRELGQIGVYVSVLKAREEKPLDLLGSPTDMQERQGQPQRRVIGILGVVDPIGLEAKSTVAALKGLGVDVWLCTGDHEATALAVARQVGIYEDNVCAGVKPEEKAELVTRLQARRGWASEMLRNKRHSSNNSSCSRVAFVGDGINDSIALARANVGIALGAGTEVAVEAADIVLVRSNLHDVVVALHLSKVVFRRIRMNFVWAMAYNLMALPFAAGILYPFTDFRLPPEYAGLMMAFSSVSVVTSSLLLRNYKRPLVLDDGQLEGGKGFLEWVMHSCERRIVLDRNRISPLFKAESGYESVKTQSSNELEMV